MKIQEKLEKLPSKTYRITVTVPAAEIEKAKESALKEMQKETEVKGFRKGKAPLEMVRKELGEDRILEHASRHFLTDAYVEAVKKHALKPFIDPKVTILKAPAGGDWEVRYEVAEAPEITKLPDYRQIAKEIRANDKKEDIWVPGKEADKKEEKSADKKRSERLQKIFDRLIRESELEISPLIMDLEVGRRLANVYDEIKQLGLSVQEYLQAKKETQESLRKKTEQEIADIYKSEFILDRISELEKITVDEKDLAKVLESAKNEQEKARLQENSYFYSRLLRKQKTLDFLGDL